MRKIAGVPREGGVKRLWGYRRRQFSVISVATCQETFEIRPALLYGDNQSLAGL